MIPAQFLALLVAVASESLVPAPRLLDVLAPPDGLEKDLFGAAVAIDRPWIAVGAPGHVHSGSLGAVYLYQRIAPHGRFEFQAEIPLSLTSGFGLTLDLDGSTLVVGAPYHAPGGAVFVFERDPTDPKVWGLVATHLGGTMDGLGTSVDIDGDTIVAGAPDQCPPTFCVPDEYAAVYERDLGGPNTWGRNKVLSSIFFGFCGSYGHDVALEGDDLFVSTPGLKYLCTGSGGMELHGRNVPGPNGWGLVSSLFPNTVRNPVQFGSLLALRGDLVASFGNYVPPPPAPQTNIVPLLEVRAESRGGAGAWGVVALLPFPEIEDHPITLSLAFLQDDILVGYPGEDAQDRGLVLLLTRAKAEYVWSGPRPLVPPASAPSDRFGFALAADDELFAVGAPGTTQILTTPRIGEVFVYSSGPTLGQPTH